MTTRLIRALALAAAALAIPAAQATESDADRAQRWKDLQQAIFGQRPVQDGSDLLTLQAPTRADDAALVPIGITTKSPSALKGLYLVIDDNPSPLAAHFTFGQAANTHEIDLRVRVDQYTQIHAIAETQDGKLYAVERFVKAAGGCSAPAGTDEADALQGLGRMKLRIAGDMAELLIRHPNFNGMQMDQVTRLYTPARFLDTVDVTYNGAKVFHLDSDISLSTNPAITFACHNQDKGQLKVVAHDSKNASFTQTFDLPQQAS
jgi:sulfur-oxidizing protein SoxY